MAGHGYHGAGGMLKITRRRGQAMRSVIVSRFGGPEELCIVEAPDPTPGPGQVVVRVTSIGMNHAELMQRRGEYKIASGDPPFTPGLEAGGVIESVGAGVTDRHVGQRVILGIDAPGRADAPMRGTYRSHFLTRAEATIPAPDAVSDEYLGAWWLAYLTAWGALVHCQHVGRGQVVLIPAASSSVGLAASQICRAHGCVTIGTTTSPAKIDRLRQMDEACYDHLISTCQSDWWQEVRRITGGRGVDVSFDPVAAGDFLNTEIRLMAQGGVIWVYGLLGQTGPVDVTPLIRKHGAIRGYLNSMLMAAGPGVLPQGYRHILDGIVSGDYRLPVARTYRLDEVQQAHAAMEEGDHIGKMILLP
jgi:NADPH2:quinone reductase